MRPTPSWFAMRATALLVAALVSGGCQDRGTAKKEATTSESPAASPAASGEVVATYKGRKLTSGEIAQEFERLPAPSRTYLAAPDRKRQFVENLVMNDLLYDEGRRAGYDKDAEIDRQVGSSRVDLQACKLEYSIVSPK